MATTTTTSTQFVRAPGLSAVDHLGRPASPLATGRWPAALFVIAVEVAERFALYGISSNLISYLTGPLQEPTASAAAAVNVWSGVSMMLPLLGAFVADSFLGRYRTIVVASIIYILGLALLTTSAMLPEIKCPNPTDLTSCPPPDFQVAIFYLSLYLIALAQGGHKPCVQAFGADQFDQNDPHECKSRSTFFNWWYFGMCASIGISIFAMSYVQDRISWGLGFGIPCIAMVLGLLVFLLGTRNYRYYLLEDENPFAKIWRTCATLIRNRYRRLSTESPLLHAMHQHEYLLYKDSDSVATTELDGDIRIVGQVEEAKALLRLLPIWASCLMFAIASAQSSTFFTKQGNTLDRRIYRDFQIPSAALQTFVSIAIVIFIPIYDRILVPIARKFTGSPSGLTMLQRIGSGIVLSVVMMVVAAVVEMKRLKTARDFGIVDEPEATIPMSFWWLVPQYLIFGMANVFTLVGMQEFFYDQVPDTLRSLGLALYLSIMGIGSLMSGLLVSVIDKATQWGGESWFSDNLNHGHLDYFYWLLMGLGVVGFIVYLLFAQLYIYKKKENTVM